VHVDDVADETVEEGATFLAPGARAAAGGAAPEALGACDGEDFLVVGSWGDGDAFALPAKFVVAGEVDAAEDVLPGLSAVGGAPYSASGVCGGVAGTDGLENQVG